MNPDRQRLTTLETIYKSAAKLDRNATPGSEFLSLGLLVGLAMGIYFNRMLSPLSFPTSAAMYLGCILLGILVSLKFANRKSWWERIFEDLAAYEPLNEAAYRDIQRKAAAGRLTAAEVRDWVDREKQAVEPMPKGREEQARDKFVAVGASSLPDDTPSPDPEANIADYNVAKSIYLHLNITFYQDQLFNLKETATRLGCQFVAGTNSDLMAPDMRHQFAVALATARVAYLYPLTSRQDRQTRVDNMLDDGYAEKFLDEILGFLRSMNIHFKVDEQARWKPADTASCTKTQAAQATECLRSTVGAEQPQD